MIEESYSKDYISECANIFKKSLQDVNFDLHDKFCDETDLRLAWESSNIPEAFLTFFSKLFDVDKGDLCKNKLDYDLIDTSLPITKEVKLLRIKSLFQIIYFIKCNGIVRALLQTLTGLFVFNTTRSKNTIKILNRLGISICYEDIKNTYSISYVR